MALLIPSSSSKATTIPEEKYIFEVEMVEVLGAILTSKKAIVLFGFVYTNPQLAPTLFFYFFDQDAFLAPHKFNVKTFPFFSKKGKPKNDLLLPQQGGSKIVWRSSRYGSYFLSYGTLRSKNLHPFPLDDPHFFRCRIVADSYTQQDTKFCRCRLNILTEKTTQ